MSTPMSPSEITLREARDWWKRLGQYLQPQDGDGPAWDAFVEDHTPAWTYDQES